jgi:hypothetical protein
VVSRSGLSATFAPEMLKIGDSPISFASFATGAVLLDFRFWGELARQCAASPRDGVPARPELTTCFDGVLEAHNDRVPEVTSRFATWRERSASRLPPEQGEIVGERSIRSAGAVVRRLRDSVVPRRTRSTPRLILYYNPDWISLPEAGPLCDGTCELTFDRTRLNEADAVIFHIPSLSTERQLVKRNGQHWVAASMESEANYPQLRSPKLLRWFDYTMTYRLDSDFPTPYLNVSIASELRTPPQAKTEAAPAVYIASSTMNRSGRTEYVRELMRYIAVDSYGRSLRNRTFAEDRGRETKLATIARYKFTLAFENSIDHDYVTEKFFDPLIAGSVPVYLGAPNISDFAPGERCYIDVTDFAGPRELADELLRLAAAEHAYQELLVWKTQPFRERFQQLVDLNRTHVLCRLCAALHS